MTVRVLFFAHQRDLFGAPEKTFDIPDGATVADLARTLASADSRLKDLLSYTRVAVNEDWAAGETQLHAGDSVAFLPPMSGG
ncbi:MAG TPA: molybdopterin converting factor subunit 1 [Capsulimonadaceae bacterium]|nr:molybdopterin converting factor subunit 1 [Capsulimonadaceae bacterium]